MSLSATLQLGDNSTGRYNKEYLVTQCLYKIFRNYNNRLPDTDARNKEIELTIVAPGKEDLCLYEWYTDKLILSGRIIFDLSGQSIFNEAPKELHFEDAYCFSLAESYHIDDQSRRHIQLKIVAEVTQIDSVSFTNIRR